jgi:hypothetical protein
MGKSPTIQSVSDTGISGEHGSEDLNVLLAPTATDDHNTFRRSIGPVACWRVEDACFEFDSSFVTPDIAPELRQLARLRQKFPQHPLSVYAHADPVGNDEYNKALCGRRAMAIYALLTRRVDMWEELFSQPFGNDKWDKEDLETMAETVAKPPEPKKPLTDEEKAIVFFEDLDRGTGCLIFAVNRGKEAEKKPDPPVAASSNVASDPKDRAEKAAHNPTLRKQLFREYMDRLCGPDLEVAKEEFLGRGIDPAGKADFQGCSEFNPILLFSKKEQQEFSRPNKKEERDAENAPNRRVMIFLFKRGVVINPQLWPCPRAKEGTGECRKRFWSDAEKRRSNQAERREFSKTKNTFSCRFYQRLAESSPCETGKIPLRIRLYDTKGRFIPNAIFRLTLKSQPVREGQASRKGILVVRPAPGSGEGFIEWGFPPVEGQALKFSFGEEIFLEFPDDPDQLADRKLQNLGYGGSAAPASERITAFQRDYREDFALDVTGELDPKTRDAINDVHDGMADRLREREA